MKNKFKETKLFKIVKQLLDGGWDVMFLPNLKTIFDTDKDGKITVKDWKNVKGWKIVGVIIVLSTLLYLEIIDFDQILLLLGI